MMWQSSIVSRAAQAAGQKRTSADRRAPEWRPAEAVKRQAAETTLCAARQHNASWCSPRLVEGTVPFSR